MSGKNAVSSAGKESPKKPPKAGKAPKETPREVPEAEKVKIPMAEPALSSAEQLKTLARYEQLATKKLPQVIKDVLKSQGTTAGRTRLAKLRQRFDALRAQVGNAKELTSTQRRTAQKILREARDISRKDFDNNFQRAVWNRLRADPDLMKIEQELRATKDVAKEGTALQVKTKGASGAIDFESLGLEHRVRLSDDPWLYNEPENLIVTDAPQNERYLEPIRQKGGVWPTTETEEFVTRYRLTDEPHAFAPGHRPPNALKPEEELVP
jgi:hypothetical protein